MSEIKSKFFASVQSATNVGTAKSSKNNKKKVELRLLGLFFTPFVRFFPLNASVSPNFAARN